MINEQSSQSDLFFRRLPLTPIIFSEKIPKKNLPPFVKQVQQIQKMIERHFDNEGYPLVMTILAPIGGGKTSFIKGLEYYLTSNGQTKKEYIFERLSAWDIPLGNEVDSESEMLGTVCQTIGTACSDWVNWVNGQEALDAVFVKKQNQVCSEMLKKAFGLRLGRSEAAQAAIAFADSSDDYGKVFAEQLIPAKMFHDFREKFTEFFKNNQENNSIVKFLLIVEDLDKRPDLIPQFLRITASFKELEGSKFGIIITGDPSPIDEALKNMVLPRGAKNKSTTPHNQMVSPSLRMSILGEEIRILPWTTSRQIAFLNRPGVPPPPNVFFWDATKIWAWFLNEWSCPREPGKEPEKSEIDILHKKMTIDFILNDVIERYYEGLIKNSNEAYAAFEDDLSLLPVTASDFNNLFDIYKKKWKNWLKNGMSLSPSDNNSKYIEIIHLLRNYLFPKTPLEMVVVTNQLIRLREQWVFEKQRPMDNVFKKDNVIDRRIRFLAHVSWCRWQEYAFGKIMEEFAYGLYGGFESKLLEECPEKILKWSATFHRKQQFPRPFIFRLENWLERIHHEAKKIGSLDRQAMCTVMSILKDLYRLRPKDGPPSGNTVPSAP